MTRATIDDLDSQLVQVESAILAVVAAVEQATEAINRWGAEIEDRLSHIEGYTAEAADK